MQRREKTSEGGLLDWCVSDLLDPLSLNVELSLLRGRTQCEPRWRSPETPFARATFFLGKGDWNMQIPSEEFHDHIQFVILWTPIIRAANVYGICASSPPNRQRKRRGCLQVFDPVVVVVAHLFSGSGWGGNETQTNCAETWHIGPQTYTYIFNRPHPRTTQHAWGTQTARFIFIHSFDGGQRMDACGSTEGRKDPAA